ncbi:MAG: HipA domain-containing protein, partial [Gammaproteobacteria bacterium]|nr:HipA domain-containing protein [Gammaproteobacteria bacterium]
RSPIDLVADRVGAKEHLFKRFILSLLTGNGDFHLENLSIIKTQNQFGFTPVYDPTPMRAYSLHNMLSVMPFGNYGDIPQGKDEPVGLNQAIKNLANNLNIKRSVTKQLIDDCLKVTEGYIDRVCCLESFPETSKIRFKNILSSVEEKIKKY